MSTPRDGYYTADVQLDTGGAIALYVNVKCGKPHDEDGKELLPEACSNFCELDTDRMVRTWPDDAAMELDALRTANAGLMERVKRLEEAGGKMAELLDCYGGFNETEEWACSTRSQHIRETRLATDAWAKAKGQP